MEIGSERHVTPRKWCYLWGDCDSHGSLGTVLIAGFKGHALWILGQREHECLHEVALPLQSLDELARPNFLGSAHL